RGHGLDPRELGVHRGEPVGLDGRFIHEARVVVADLLLGAARRGVRGGRLVDDVPYALLRELIELGEDAEARAILGNVVRVVPLAARAGEEIIARLHLWLASREIEAEVANLRLRRRRWGRDRGGRRGRRGGFFGGGRGAGGDAERKRRKERKLHGEGESCGGNCAP